MFLRGGVPADDRAPGGTGEEESGEGRPRFSIVIPVYNSAGIVGETIEACLAFFRREGHAFEVILVNDGSEDGSWEVLCEKVAVHPELVAVDLLHNCGQHTALLCGLGLSRGEWAITLDDDLQNPPEECRHLIRKAEEGHDAVFGRFRVKRHSWSRRMGSRLVDALNRRVFGKPRDLTLTNFRILHRRVIGRMLTYRTVDPYINGLALMSAEKPTDVLVEHRPRTVGASSYGSVKIAELLMRILFNYSAYPLRVVSFLGLSVALCSLCLALYFFVRGLLFEPRVPGWASVAVMLASFNGISLLILGILGEYLVRVLQQLTRGQRYHVVQVLRHAA
jgi:glycosyltransferase involved in cell wall biosynthesis